IFIFTPYFEKLTLKQYLLKPNDSFFIILIINFKRTSKKWQKLPIFWPKSNSPCLIDCETILSKK
ncbi:hypothetical protein BpHYR1_010347, partial [Brachionus plicatilis]